MNFEITPDRDYTHISSVTENGQFRVLVSWEPEYLESNSNAKIIFPSTHVVYEGIGKVKNDILENEYTEEEKPSKGLNEETIKFIIDPIFIIILLFIIPGGGNREMLSSSFIILFGCISYWVVLITRLVIVKIVKISSKSDSKGKI